MYTDSSEEYSLMIILMILNLNILSYQRFNLLCDIEFPKAGMWTGMI